MHLKEEDEAVVLRGTPTCFLCDVLVYFPCVRLDISPSFQRSITLDSLQAHRHLRTLGAHP